jgi:hypothetical protein
MLVDYFGVAVSTICIGGLSFLFIKFFIDVIRGKYRSGQS